MTAETCPRCSRDNLHMPDNGNYCCCPLRLRGAPQSKPAEPRCPWPGCPHGAECVHAKPAEPQSREGWLAEAEAVQSERATRAQTRREELGLAEPSAGALPELEPVFGHIEVATALLEAIPARQRRIGDVLEPVRTIADATKLVNGALHRLSLAEVALASIQARAPHPLPELPTTDVLDDLYNGRHHGHPADFAAEVLERWGGWQPGLLGHGGRLAKAYPYPTPTSKAFQLGWNACLTVQARASRAEPDNALLDDTWRLVVRAAGIPDEIQFGNLEALRIPLRALLVAALSAGQATSTEETMRLADAYAEAALEHGKELALDTAFGPPDERDAARQALVDHLAASRATP